MRFLCLFLPLVLCGCVTWAQMDAGLQRLHGRPLSAAIDRLGYPSGERDVAGMKLVTWSTRNSGTMYLPQTATGQATAYNPYTGYTTYTTTTSYLAPMAYNYQCEITMHVNEGGIIVGTQYQGNMGGCSSYIKALDRPDSTSYVGVPMPAEFKSAQ